MNNRVKKNGFTLIEAVIAMAIIGILIAIAISSYQDKMTQVRRSDAKAVLLGFAHAMDRHFSAKDQYCDAGGTGGVDTCGDDTNDTGSPSIYAAKSPIEGNEAFYTLTISSISPTTYTLRAIPTGVQANDECGTLTLNQKGARGITGQAPGITADDCW